MYRSKLLGTAALVAGLVLSYAAGVPLSSPAAAAPPVEGQGLSTAKPTQAVDDGNPASTIETAAQAYRSAYPQMSLDTAREAAAQQGSREALRAELAKDADTFGGVWFDPPSGVLHVAVTTAAAEVYAIDLGSQLGLRVQLHRVARSLGELEDQAAALRTGRDGLSLAADGRVGIDVTTNQVTVAVPQQQRSALGPAPSGVTLVPATDRPIELDVCTSRSNCDDSLRAGLVISSTGGSCSIGFTARSSSGLTRWALTAGHCSDGTSTTVWSTGGTAIGPLTSAIDSGAVDAAAIQVTNATYRADTAGRIYRTLPVNGAAEVMSDISVGDVVCLSANITDPTATSNPCATIGSVSDANARGLVRVDGYDGCNGDSGGGWYVLAGGVRTAYGLHSRSDEGCKVANGTSWFSALPRFWTALVYETS